MCVTCVVTFEHACISVLEVGYHMHSYLLKAFNCNLLQWMLALQGRQFVISALLVCSGMRIRLVGQESFFEDLLPYQTGLCTTDASDLTSRHRLFDQYY
jgi:hypothetical protein